jgi:deazaflavin-dependent oxidoreductase (nitroreductase family)
MSNDYDHAGPFRRWLRRFAASGPGSWLFAPILHRIDRPVHRLTCGRATFTSALSGMPVVMLTTTGARSGLPRTVPLVGLGIADGIAVIASNFGRRDHPAWSRNLQAHPDATVTVRGRERAMHATAAEGERRAEIWRRGLEVYPGFAQYELRAAHRSIVVWLLRPVADPSDPHTPVKPTS